MASVETATGMNNRMVVEKVKVGFVGGSRKSRKNYINNLICFHQVRSFIPGILLWVVPFGRNAGRTVMSQPPPLSQVQGRFGTWTSMCTVSRLMRFIVSKFSSHCQLLRFKKSREA